MAADDDGIAPEADDTRLLFCTICDKSFKGDKEYKQHIRLTHTAKNHKCKVSNCPFSAPSADGLIRHITNKHYDRDVKCDKCGKGFQTEGALKEHLKYHDQKPYQCEHTHCKIMFKTEDELKKHKETCKERRWVQDDADSIRPYKCLVCDKRFMSAKTVQEHTHTHDDRKLLCSKCQKPFANPKTLGDHMRTDHSDAKGFPCTRCDMVFKQKITLQRHLNSSPCKVAWEKAQKAQTQAKGPSHGTSALPSKNEKSALPANSAANKTNIPDKPKADSTAIKDTTVKVMAPDESPKDDNGQPRSLRALFGETVHQRVQARFEAIQAVLGRSVYTTMVSTPSAGSQLAMGKNLQAFHNAQYVDSLAAISNPVAGQSSTNLKKFLAGRAYRKLFATYKGSPDKGYERITVQNFQSQRTALHHEAIHIEISHLNLTKELMEAYAKKLRDIFERVPTFFALMSDDQQMWAKRAALRLVFDENSKAQLQLTSPSYLAAQRTVSCQVYGYNPAKNEAWYLRLRIPVGPIDQKKRIDIPNAQRIKFVDVSDRAAVFGRPDLQPTSADKMKSQSNDAQAAYKLAQSLSAQFFGFIGTLEDCHNEAVSIIDQYWIKGKEEGKRLKPLQTLAGRAWKGEAFFEWREAGGTHTTFLPTSITKDNMQGGSHNIHVYSISSAKRFLVANVMLLALRAKHDFDTVWGIGSALADIENSFWDEELPIVSCSIKDAAHKKEVDLCPECLVLFPHNKITQKLAGFQPYSTCDQCEVDFMAIVKDPSIEGNVVGSHLFKHLKKEDEHAETKKQLKMIRAEQRRIWSNLKSSQEATSDNFNDGYIAQTLNVNGPRETAWDGTKWNPLFPSIEAIDPVTVLNKRTAYHVLNNIMIVSDSINRAKKHYPPLVIHGVKLFREAIRLGDQAMYESAITIFRILVSNHYVYGDLGQVQQTKRIGVAMPADWDKIATSFRQPLLLSSTIPNERTFRFLASRQSIPAGQRAKYVHPQHDWLYSQLGHAAAEVFKGFEKKYEHLWLRQDGSGRNVFFPFSTKYSIVDDWTEWDLFEFLGVRAVRNVTKCQAPHSRDNPIPQYSAEELFLTIVNLWLRMLKRDIDKGLPLYACGQDETKLVPQPTINDLLCASLGHRWPGQTEDLGLINFDMTSDKPVGFDASKCGMMWETQFCNYLKFKYAVSSLDRVFSQLDGIRVDNQIIANPDPVLPKTLCSLTLTMFPDPFSARKGPSKLWLDAENAASLSIKEAREASVFVSGSGKDLVKIGPNELTATEIPPPTNDKQIVPDSDDLAYDDFVDDDDLIELTYPPKARNLSNLGASCYANVIFQLLANIPVFHVAFSKSFAIKRYTGRPPTTLSVVDDLEGTKHTNLIQALQQILSSLHSGGEQISSESSEVPFFYIENLQSHAGEGFKPDVQNEAVFFFNWLMEKTNVSTDHSNHLAKPDVWTTDKDGAPLRRFAYSPEEELNLHYKSDLANGRQVDSLSDYITKHWRAHLASGYDSPVTDTVTTQYVDLYQCSSETCPIVERMISYSDSMLLRISKVTNVTGQVIPLRSLIRANLEEHFSSKSVQETPLQAQAYPCCAKAHAREGQEGGEYLRKVTRITKAPRLFVVEVNRRKVALPADGEPASEDSPILLEPEPHMQRITEYDQMDMSDWSNDAPIVNHKSYGGQSITTHEVIESDALAAKYDVIGIVAYSRDIAHYTVFIKLEGSWVYFDDMRGRPEYRDPWTNWPEGFVESMLCYQREGEVAAIDSWQPAASLDEGLFPGTEEQTAQQREITSLANKLHEAEAHLKKKDEEQSKQKPSGASAHYTSTTGPLKDDQAIASLLDHLSNTLSNVSDAKSGELVTKVRGMLDSLVGTSPVAPSAHTTASKQADLSRKASVGNLLRDFTGKVTHKRDRSEANTPRKEAKQQRMTTPSPEKKEEKGKSPGTRQQVKNAFSGLKSRAKSGDWFGQVTGTLPSDQQSHVSGHSTKSTASSRPAPNTNTSIPASLLGSTSSVNTTTAEETPSRGPRAGQPKAETPSLAAPASMKRRVGPDTASTQAKRTRSGLPTDPSAIYDMSSAPPRSNVMPDPAAPVRPRKGSFSARPVDKDTPPDGMKGALTKSKGIRDGLSRFTGRRTVAAPAQRTVSSTSKPDSQVGGEDEDDDSNVGEGSESTKKKKNTKDAIDKAKKK